MIETHRISPDEWPAMRELRLEALQDTPTAFVERYDESVLKPDDFWQARVLRGSAGDRTATFVASDGERLVGKATCYIEDDVTDHLSAHVVGVYVTPTWRGREDLAGRVVGAAVAWAREVVHADRIRLFVTDVNPRAAAFYRRLGFVESGLTLPYPHDPTIVEIEMVHRPVS